MQLVTTNGLSGSALTTNTGKVVGSRLKFNQDGSMSAKDIKAQLKDEGIKGRELTRQVNAVLTGEKDIRWAKHDAATSILRSNGMVPDYTDCRKGSAVTRYVLAEDATALKHQAQIKAANEESAELRKANEELAAELVELRAMAMAGK